MHVVKYKIIVYVVAIFFIFGYLPSILSGFGHFFPAYAREFIIPFASAVAGFIFSYNDKIVEWVWGDEDQWVREIEELSNHSHYNYYDDSYLVRSNSLAYEEEEEQ